MTDNKTLKEKQKLYYENNKNNADFKKKRYEYYSKYYKNRIKNDEQFRVDRNMYFNNYYKNVTKKNKALNDEAKLKEKKEKLLLQILIKDKDTERND